MTATTEAPATPTLNIRLEATVRISACIDLIAWYATFTAGQRDEYRTWNPDNDEYFAGCEDDYEPWQKPLWYLEGYFAENAEADAGFAGMPHICRDHSDAPEVETPTVDRDWKRGDPLPNRKWTEDDYRALIRAVPWLAALDTTEPADPEAARVAPNEWDVPLFEVNP